MSGWKGHLFGGIFFVSILLTFNYFYSFLDIEFTLVNVLLILLITLFYSLSPDLDHRISQLRFMITLLGLILIGVLALTSNIIPLIIIVVLLIILWVLPECKGWGHRGKMHTILFGIFITLPLLLISWEIALIGLIAFISHLILDGDLSFWK